MISTRPTYTYQPKNINMNTSQTNQDIISDLPDAILSLILSKTHLKSAVATSVVSKRWLKISTEYLSYTNILDFGENFAWNQTPDKFTETVNKILNINKSKQIQRFKLVFSPRNNVHRLNAVKWIKFATDKRIKEIELDFCRHIHVHFLSMDHIVNGREAFVLPGFLFEYGSLSIVKLSRCILAVPETFTGFSRLSTLCLKEVHIKDEMLENLVLHCNLLEVLVLKECGSLSRVKVKSPVNLKRLTVYECYNASVIEISGPNIRSVLISSGHLDCCKLENLWLLDQVFIGTRGDEFGGVMYIFMDVLVDIAHVRFLTLYLGHLVPSLFKEFKVKFSNLEELMLVNSPLFGLFNTDVYCFFKHCSCPSLKKITIELSTVSEEENFIWEYRKPNIDPTKCVFNNLTNVILLNFRGTNTDIDLTTYFLKSAPILETMILVTPKKSNVSCSTSNEDDSFIGIQKATSDTLVGCYKASSIVDIRIVSEYIGHNSLLSILEWHHVSDVYNK